MLILPTLVRASARLAARPLLKVPAAVSVLPSTLRSSRWYASSVDPDNNHMRGSTPASQLSDEYERLANNPEAMSAIENMIKVMKANGVDLTSFDQPPSMWQLVQLARNEDVKTASFAVLEHLTKEGIEVSPEKLSDLLHCHTGILKKIRGEK